MEQPQLNGRLAVGTSGKTLRWLIRTKCKEGRLKEAIQLLNRLNRQGLEATPATYACLLQECGNWKALAEGQWVHAQIVKSGFGYDTSLGNKLVLMYNECGSVSTARQIFDKMLIRDVVSWNAMLSGYASHGQAEQVFKLFQQMVEQGVQPNKSTFIRILDGCVHPQALALRKLAHALIVDSGVESNVFVMTALVSMYGKCGSIDEARKLFDKMPERNVVSWNAMIAEYARHGQSEEAFYLYRQMQEEGVKPVKSTFISILKACDSQEDLSLGKLVNSDLLNSGLVSDVVLETALVSMYIRCGCIENAYKIFTNMPTQNVVSWTTMIAGYTRYGNGEEAFKLFLQMQEGGVKPNRVTYISILDSCASPKALTMGRLFHACIIHSGIEQDVVVGNALVTMYSRCGSIEDAGRMFYKIPERSLVSWNSMITAYSKHGYGDEAFRLFQKMQQEGIEPDSITLSCILNAFASSDALALAKLVHASIVYMGIEFSVVVWNTLVNMYGKCCTIEDARRMFDKMPERDVASWNAMIAGYARLGYGKDALVLFQQMWQEGVKPDFITFISILDACGHVAALPPGRLVHAYITDSGLESDIIVGTALVTMYGKCGSIKDARAVFDKMSKQSIVLWNAMIAAYSQHGDGKEALQLFQQLRSKGINPNDLTFTSVLRACSHAGLVDEGLYIFKFMYHDYGIRPSLGHYNCIVDILGRAGRLVEAQEFIDKMPFQPDVVTWMTLLGSCRAHGCTEVAKLAAERVLELNPQLASAYVVLSNIYALGGRWDEATRLRRLMVDRAVKKEPGCTWIDVSNNSHEFVVGDKSHPQTKEIYADLERLIVQIKEDGYVPDTKLVLHDVEEELKEQLICHHSEKLAMVFGLISTPCGMALCIIKNQRMCCDCHIATKFISKIAGREIVVRDAGRFHHFLDGVCSCGDYW